MTLPRQSDYTSRDFSSIRQRLINLIKTTFPSWTDFDVASFGNILIEMFAFVGDVLTFYQDAQARESRIVTATQRKNIIALAKLIGYRLPGAKAATVDVEFSLAAPPIADVMIPEGTIVRTADVTEPISFQLLEAVTIPAGSDPPISIGTLEHSVSHHQRFEGTGEKDQTILLTYTPYLDGSLNVTAGGQSYTEVESFLNSKAQDQHFAVSVDQNDQATIRFGNGVNGSIPSGTIDVNYKTGGGRKGLVDSESLVVIEGQFADVHSNPVQVSVTNPHPSSGGEDRQSIEQAKALAPASLRTMNRTVCREDFEIHATKLPGVARALMLTSNEMSVIEENTGILFVIPTGGGQPTHTLKDEVLHQVNVVYPHTLTFNVRLQDPVYHPVNVETVVHFRQGFVEAEVTQAIEQTLKDFFAMTLLNGLPNPAIDFGFNIKDSKGKSIGELPWSDIFNVVRDVSGVRKVTKFLINGQMADVVLSLEAFPILGNITLINGDN